MSVTKKRVLSRILVFIMIFALLPISQLKVLAETIDESLKTGNSKAVELVKSNLQAGTLEEGEPIILEFDSNISPSTNFNISKVYKKVDKQVVEITTGKSVEVNKIPLFIRMGIKDNLLKVELVEEQFEVGKEYEIFIPKNALQDENGNNLDDDIQIEFKVVPKKEVHKVTTGQAVELNLHRIDQNGTLNCWYLSLFTSRPMVSIDSEKIQLFDEDKKEIPGLQIEIDKYNSRCGNLFKINQITEADKSYSIYIPKDSITFDGGYLEEDVILEFNTYGVRDVTPRVAYIDKKEEKPEEEELYIYLGRSASLDASKMELLDLTNNESIGIKNSACGTYEILDIEEKLINEHEYKIVFNKGSILDLYLDPIDYEGEYCFTYRDSYVNLTEIKAEHHCKEGNINLNENQGVTLTAIFDDNIRELAEDINIYGNDFFQVQGTVRGKLVDIGDVEIKGNKLIMKLEPRGDVWEDENYRLKVRYPEGIFFENLKPLADLDSYDYEESFEFTVSNIIEPLNYVESNSDIKVENGEYILDTDNLRQINLAFDKEIYRIDQDKVFLKNLTTGEAVPVENIEPYLGGETHKNICARIRLEEPMNLKDRYELEVKKGAIRNTGWPYNYEGVFQFKVNYRYIQPDINITETSFIKDNEENINYGLNVYAIFNEDIPFIDESKIKIQNSKGENLQDLTILKYKNRIDFFTEGMVADEQYKLIFEKDSVIDMWGNGTKFETEINFTCKNPIVNIYDMENKKNDLVAKVYDVNLKKIRGGYNYGEESYIFGDGGIYLKNSKELEESYADSNIDVISMNYYEDKLYALYKDKNDNTLKVIEKALGINNSWYVSEDNISYSADINEDVVIELKRDFNVILNKPSGQVTMISKDYKIEWYSTNYTFNTKSPIVDTYEVYDKLYVLCEEELYVIENFMGILQERELTSIPKGSKVLGLLPNYTSYLDVDIVHEGGIYEVYEGGVEDIQLLNYNEAMGDIVGVLYDEYGEEINNIIVTEKGYVYVNYDNRDYHPVHSKLNLNESVADISLVKSKIKGHMLSLSIEYLNGQKVLYTIEKLSNGEIVLKEVLRGLDIIEESQGENCYLSDKKMILTEKSSGDKELPKIDKVYKYKKYVENQPKTFIDIEFNENVSILDEDKTIEAINIMSKIDRPVTYEVIPQDNKKKLSIKITSDHHMEDITSIDINDLVVIDEENIINTINNQWNLEVSDAEGPYMIDVEPTIVKWDIDRDIIDFTAVFDEEAIFNKDKQYVKGIMDSQGNIINCTVNYKGQAKDKILLKPLENLEYGKEYFIYFEEGALKDTNGNLNKTIKYRFETMDYVGPVVDKIECKTATEYKDNRKITLDMYFKENIEGTRAIEELKNQIKLYRVDENEKYRKLKSIYDFEVIIIDNKVTLKFSDYFKDESVEYKIKLHEFTLRGAESGKNSAPIINEIKVSDKDSPYAINTEETTKKMARDVYQKGYVELLFNEDIFGNNPLMTVYGEFGDLPGVGSVKECTANGSIENNKLVIKEVNVKGKYGIKTVPIAEVLLGNKEYKITIKNGGIKDKSGNLNDQTDISFKTGGMPSYSTNGYNLPYINSPIIVKFNKEIEDVGNIESLSGSLDIANVFFREDTLYIIPQIKFRASDLKDNGEYKNISLYNKKDKDINKFQGYIKKKKYKVDKNAAHKFYDKRNLTNYYDGALKYYLNPKNVIIPDGFIQFKDNIVKTNQKIDITKSFAVEKATETLKYKKFYYYVFYWKWKSKSLKADTYNFKYMNLNIDKEVIDVFNKNDIITNTPLRLKSNESIVWDIDENGKSVIGSSVEAIYDTEGRKKVTAVYNNEAFQYMNVDVHHLPDVENGTILNTTKRTLNFGLNESKKDSEKITISLPINLICKDKRNTIPYEGKEIKVYRAIDSSEFKQVGTVETDNQGKALYSVKGKEVYNFIKNNNEKIVLKFETQELAKEILEKPVTKELFVTLNKNDIKCTLSGQIELQVGRRELSEEFIKNSIKFKIDSPVQENKEEFCPVIKSIKYEDEKIIVSYEVRDLKPSEDTKLTVKTKLFTDISVRGARSAYNTSEEWVEKTLNVPIMAESVTQDIVLKGLNKNIGKFNIVNTYIASREENLVTQGTLDKTEESTDPHVYIRGVNAVDTLITEVDWKEQKPGLVILKSVEKPFNVINNGGELDIAGEIYIEDNFETDKEQVGKEGEIIVKLNYKEKAKSQSKGLDIYELNVDFSKLPKGYYNILAVNKEGVAVVAKQNLRIAPKLPAVFDATAYYLNGEYAISASIEEGLSFSAGNVIPEIPGMGGHELGLDLSSLFDFQENLYTVYGDESEVENSKLKGMQDFLSNIPLSAAFDNENMSFTISAGINGLDFVNKKNPNGTKSGESVSEKNLWNRELTKTKRNDGVHAVTKKVRNVGGANFDVTAGFEYNMVLADSNYWEHGGGITVHAGAGFEWSYYYIVPLGFIPIPLYVTAGIDGGIGIKLGFMVENGGKVRFVYVGSIEVNGHIAAGIGICLIKGEFFAEGGVGVEIDGSEDYKHPEINIAANFELGVRLIIDLWLWSKTFKASWGVEWDKTIETKKSKAAAFKLPEEAQYIDYKDIISDSAELMPRRDMASEGFTNEITNYRSNAGGINRLANKMVKNVNSDYTEQKLAQLGDNKVMIALLDDDPKVSSMDRNQLVYAILDQNGISPFERVDTEESIENATLDSSFQMTEYKDTVAAAWIDYNKSLSNVEEVNSNISENKVEKVSEVKRVEEKNLENESVDGNEVIYASKPEQVDDSEIKNSMKYADVSVAIYDEKSDSWNKHNICNDNVRDGSPEIAANDENIIVTWNKNNGNEVIQDNVNKDVLYYCEYDGGLWSKDKKVGIDISSGMVMDYSTTIIGDTIYLVYTFDSDSDESTNTDREIYYVKKDIGEEAWSKEIRITTNNMNDERPRVVNIKGEHMLVWKQNPKLMYINNIENIEEPKVAVEKFQTSEDYDVVYNSYEDEMYVTWSRVVSKFTTEKNEAGKEVKKFDQNVMEVFTSIYDEEGGWSNPIQLTSDSRFNRFVDTTVYNDRLKLIYSSAYIDFNILTDENERDKMRTMSQLENDRDKIETTSQLQNQMYRMLRMPELPTGVVLAEFEKSHDLSITDAYVEVENTKPGEHTPVNVVIKNNGTYKEENVKLNVSLEDSGDIIGKKVIDGPIMPGDEIVTLLSIETPQYDSAKNLNISMELQGDINEEDNSAAVPFIFEDISFEGTTKEYLYGEDAYRIRTIVRNTSNIPIKELDIDVLKKKVAENDKFSFTTKEDEYEESVKFTADFFKTPLMPNETREVNIIINEENIDDKKGDFIIVISPNKGITKYTLPLKLERYAVAMLNYSITQKENQLIINAVFNDKIKAGEEIEEIKLTDGIRSIKGKSSIDNNVLSFMLNDISSLDNDTMYKLQIPKNAIKNLDGKSMLKDVSINYNKITEDLYKDDTYAPKAITYGPYNEEDGIDPNETEQLIIGFNEKVDKVSGKKVTVKEKNGRVVKEVYISDETVRLESEKAAVIDIGNVLKYGKEYEVIVEAGAFIDIYGNEFQGIESGEWLFATEKDDSEPEKPEKPEIDDNTDYIREETFGMGISTNKGIDENYDISVDKEIELVFKDNMKKSSNFDHITFKDEDGKEIPMEINIKSNKLIVKSKETLKYGNEYKITIPSNSLKSYRGIKNEFIVYRFTTEHKDMGEYIQWRVKENVPNNKKWTIRFNEALGIKENEGEKYIKVFDSKGKEVSVCTEISGNNLIIKSVQNYNSKETYTLEISKDIASRKGQKLSKKIVMKFTVK